jgi:hypothetical protein
MAKSQVRDAKGASTPALSRRQRNRSPGSRQFSAELDAAQRRHAALCEIGANTHRQESR